MSQNINTGLTQVELVSQQSGVTLTPKYGYVNSGTATTIGTVPVGKVWKIYGFTHGFFNNSVAESANSQLKFGSVVVSEVWHNPVGDSNEISLSYGNNFVQLTAGQTVTISCFDISHKANATIFYSEEDA
jgi:hypothetical protein